MTGPTSSSRVSSDDVLRAEEIFVNYVVRGEAKIAVSGASFGLRAGGSLGIVGESGSGKSTLARAVFGVLPANGVLAGGRVWFDGIDVTPPSALLDRKRWKDISFVPQSSMASLDPLYKIGRQLSEALEFHHRLGRREATLRLRPLLEAFHLPPYILDMYPHELSGGMKQRVVIAAALVSEPQVVIADEPTTALDNLVQAKVFENFDLHRRKLGASLILVTHDMGLVADFCEHIMVMQGGRVVEQGTTDNVLKHPQHAYTRQLLAAMPRVERAPRQLAARRSDAERQTDGAGAAHPILEFRKVSRRFRRRRSWTSGNSGYVEALREVSFSVGKGEVLGIIGASGSGKTTIANIALGLDQPTSGQVTFGEAAETASPGAARLSRRAQLIFQNPYEALNPIYQVEWVVAEPMRSPAFPFGERVADLAARVRNALAEAGLKPVDDFLARPLYQLSGGQRQRAAIARAIIARPDLIIADEPVSMLDVSIRAEVLRTLRELVDTENCGMIYITHDLATVGAICDTLVVLRQGEVVETGACLEIVRAPQSDYTLELLDAIPGRALRGAGRFEPRSAGI